MGFPVRYALKRAVESSKEREYRDTTDMLIEDMIKGMPKLVGLNLRGYQKENYLTDKEMADILRVNLETLESFKKGRCGMNIRNVMQIALRVNIPIDDLTTKDIYGLSKEKWHNA